MQEFRSQGRITVFARLLKFIYSKVFARLLLCVLAGVGGVNGIIVLVSRDRTLKTKYGKVFSSQRFQLIQILIRD